MLSLLAFFEVSYQTTKTVTYISIGVVVLLLLIILAFSFKQKRLDTLSVAFAGVCIALSFVLSYIKIPSGAFGGSVTLASLVPLIIYSYVYGPLKGLLAGLIYGLLQFIQAPYLLTPLTFFLDYIFAFIGIAFVGVAKYVFKNKTKTAVLTGTTLAFVWRFVMHLFSGIIYFSAGYVVEGLPAANAWLYSFVYQLTYVPFDALIAIAVLVLLLFTPSFNRLTNVMRKKD